MKCLSNIFIYQIFIFQIVHFQKNFEEQCLYKNRLTPPLYILLGVYVWMKIRVILESFCSLESGVVLMPKFKHLEDLKPPKWSIFHQSGRERTRKVSLTSVSSKRRSVMVVRVVWLIYYTKTIYNNIYNRYLTSKCRFQMQIDLLLYILYADRHVKNLISVFQISL